MGRVDGIYIPIKDPWISLVFALFEQNVNDSYDPFTSK